MKHVPGGDPLFREVRIARVVGWPLLVISLLAGVGSGLAVIAIGDPVMFGRMEWLVVPACVPVCYSLARGRSLLAGAVGGFFAALTAFMTVGLYGLWQVACFIITFMGEC